jgi:hypothetical protein
MKRALQARSRGGPAPAAAAPATRGWGDAPHPGVVRAPTGGSPLPAAGASARAGTGPIQAKFIVRDGKIEEVADEYELREGEQPAESLRLHPVAAEYLQRHERTEGNVEGVLGRQRQERANDLAGLHHSGIVDARTRALLRTRIGTPADQPGIGAMFSMATSSKSHDERTRTVASDLMGRMLRNVVSTGNLNARRRNLDMAPLGVDDVPGNESARLGVEYHAGTAPHYAPGTNTISLMMNDQLDQAGHELQHAHDHIHGNLDLHEPSHRLHSEELAFAQQDRVSREDAGRPPQLFKGRTPDEMARSYEGKKGYPGTLDESRDAVEEWRRGKR